MYLPDGNVLRPDLCIVSDPSAIGDDDKIHGVPDLCIEVLSRSTAKNDLGKKMTLYARNGVKEHWIIYPHDKVVNVYKSDKIQVGLFPDLNIDVNRVFRSPFT